ncbi:ATPase, V1 complex, subunit H [Nadsonia fulvescens var. elongata DSM 6958]|uniref:V-type proton ATPase subunit H n=1 Tax=Nadsonia fulvescens var. elongata DSM 6958 TaxID=857566 RepID=A0A1E3PFK0_9ASCO|nr:ATPase, V1 complex, subunit H [Nadsonia fulvescens var. elongata DSM 6958]
MASKIPPIANPTSVSFPSSYVDEIQATISARPIPWEGYLRAKLLTSTEASVIKSIEKQSKEKRKAIVEKDLDLYSTTSINLIQKLTRDDIVKFILSLIADLVTDLPVFAESLVSLSMNDKDTPYDPFLKLLQHTDEAIYLLSAKILTVLFTVRTAPSDKLIEFIKFVNDKLLKSSDNSSKEIAVISYGIILSVKSYREVFWQSTEELMPSLLTILVKNKSDLQLQYYTLLVLWLVTFETIPSRDFVVKFDAVPVYIEVIKNSIKEKIVRISVATLVNLVKKSSESSINSLLANQGLPFFKNLCERKWADEELISDLQYLLETLQESFESMTTFDEYINELNSKKLRWSPPHKSDEFWKVNAQKFKEGDWKYLKQISDIVLTSNNPVHLAVASNDLARIVKELPASIKVLESSSTKTKVMTLLAHEDSEVKYEALKATQAFVANTFK